VTDESGGGEPVGLGERQILQTLPQDVGKRLDVYLAEHFVTHSRGQLRLAIQHNGVLVDGLGKKAAYRLRGGERIEVTVPAVRREGPIAEDIPLSVLFEDEHLVVIDKAPSMVVHPARGHWRGTLTSALAHRFQQLSSVAGPARPGIVHRLDRDTSGVILVAKTDAAHLNLTRQFADRTVEKEYLAICRGACDKDRDQIDQPIGPHPYQREKMAIRRDHVTSRPATTFFEVADRYRGHVVFRTFPKTGRDAPDSRPSGASRLPGTGRSVVLGAESSDVGRFDWGEGWDCGAGPLRSACSAPRLPASRDA
jgi:23S rRNA pseudouridine1911/1915/1917 synthase